MSQDREPLVLPQLRLDDLLTELQHRLEAVFAARDRVHTLLEAVVSIGGRLELDEVLRRVTEAAVALAGARYGALGVIAEDGEHLEKFVTVGVTDQEIAAIGHWPHGHGLLGVLIREPESLRLDDLAEHAESSGLPTGHPAMSGFLGVPIRSRGRVFGNLYLTEKKGGGRFEEDDEVIVNALATAAGVAIENARLYEEARVREAWLEASAEISTALLSGTAPADVLCSVARRARMICDADLATVALADGAELSCDAVDGEGAQPLLGVRIPQADSVVGGVFRSGRTLMIPDVQALENRHQMPGGVEFGSVIVVPLGRSGEVRGLLTVGNLPGRPAFTDRTRRLLEPFAHQAAVGLALAESRSDTERLARLEDRDRIAKDLHDTVIQRLFASAMTLMSAVRLSDRPEVSRRIQNTVDDLDETIRQIRSTIFSLQADTDQESLRARVHSLVDAAATVLGFAPTVRLDGLVDTEVPPRTADHLLAVLTEALSNVARHAGASSAEVVLTVSRGWVRLAVTDDGRGVPAQVHRSGLRNLAERAEALSGTFTLTPAGTGGTVLDWSVPLSSD